MILPVKKLIHVESYKCDEGLKKTKDYNTYVYDKITVNYSQIPREFSGKKNKEWTEEFEFIRTSRPDEKEGYTIWRQTVDYIEMKQCLNTHTKGLSKIISKKDYDFFKEKFPERFV